MASDPETMLIIKTFNEAIEILDASEPIMRDMIENALMDVAGINKTRVSDARLSLDALAMDIVGLRVEAIKAAFRHLRTNLPTDF